MRVEDVYSGCSHHLFSSSGRFAYERVGPSRGRALLEADLACPARSGGVLAAVVDPELLPFVERYRERGAVTGAFARVPAGAGEAMAGPLTELYEALWNLPGYLLGDALLGGDRNNRHREEASEGPNDRFVLSVKSHFGADGALFVYEDVTLFER